MYWIFYLFPERTFLGCGLELSLSFLEVYGPLAQSIDRICLIVPAVSPYIVASSPNTVISIYQIESSPKALSLDTMKQILTPSIVSPLQYLLGGKYWAQGHILYKKKLRGTASFKIFIFISRTDPKTPWKYQ